MSYMTADQRVLTVLKNNPFAITWKSQDKTGKEEGVMRIAFPSISIFKGT